MEKQNLLSKYNRIKFTPSKYASLLDELSGVLDFEEPDKCDSSDSDGAHNSKFRNKGRCKRKSQEDSDDEAEKVSIFPLLVLASITKKLNI